MRMLSLRIATLALTAAVLAAAGCSREDTSGKGGPGERAGRQVDRALDKAGQAVEKAGRDMQGASKGQDSSKESK